MFTATAKLARDPRHAATIAPLSEALRARPFAPIRRSVVLVLFDLGALFLAAWVGFSIWRVVNPAIPSLNATMLLVPLCCTIQFTFSGHYPGLGLTAVEHLRRICKGVTMIYLLFVAVMFLAKTLANDSRGALSLAWASSLVFVPASRWLATHLYARCPWWSVPVVVIGTGESSRSVIRALVSNQILGYEPVACLHDEPGETRYCEGIPIVGGLKDAAAVVRGLGARHAVIALQGMHPNLMLRHMRRWRFIFARILIVPELAGVASLWTETRDLGGIVALETRQKLLNPWNQRVKRAIDIAFAIVGLLAAAPVIAVSAIWVRRVSSGSPFYTQLREGKGGLPLRVFKLRTMYPDAESALHRHLAANSAARAEWERFCKLKRDPRVLPGIGTFLRKTSLDELPQLWNILKGEMSMVGPRPFPEYHNARFDPDFRAVRLRVTPGLTGLWQVSARSNGDLAVQQDLDSYYIRNWSLWLDAYLLIRTVRAILGRDGAC